MILVLIQAGEDISQRHSRYWVPTQVVCGEICRPVKLTVSTNSAAVLFSTFHRAAPTLGMAGAGGKRGDGLAINLDSLSVVSASIVKLIYKDLLVGISNFHFSVSCVVLQCMVTC